MSVACSPLDGRRRAQLRASDVPNLLRTFDLLAVPSLSDGSPLVVHEALELGTPVVGSAVGGIPDRLGGGSAGLLAPPGDAVGLAKAIVYLVTDASARGELVRRGRSHARQHTYDAMVTAVSQVHDLARSSARRGAP